MRHRSNRLIVVSISLAICISTVGQAQQAREMDSAPRRTMLGKDEVVIPMTQQFHHARVEGHINGQGPFRFVIDTGAPGLTVSSALAERLKLDPPPDVPPGVEVGVRVSSGSGEGVPAKMVWAEMLKLGDAEFSGVRTVSLDLPSTDHDGVIGMNIFRDVLLAFDYPESKIVLRKGDLGPVNGKDILAYTQARSSGSHPSIEVDVCGQRVPFVIDSGMSGWFRVNSEIAGRCGLAVGPVAGPSARTVDRIVPTQLGRIAGDVVIGSQAFTRPVVMIDSNATPLIGGAALANFVVTIDQRRQRIQFESQRPGPIDCPSVRVLGLGLRGSDGGLEVWEIMEGSPGSKLDIQIGDRVTSINRRPAKEIYGSREWGEVVKGRSIELEIQRGSSSHKVKVPVWEIVP